MHFLIYLYFYGVRKHIGEHKKHKYYGGANNKF
jgi:hypothetical protein